MKKVGLYTARGIVTEAETEAGTPQKISLFDGKFTTGYKITDFKIWCATVTGNSADVVGKLSKNEFGVTTQANFLRADDDNQIAWAGGEGFSDHLQGITSIIDPDNLIVEDLYVYVRSNDAAGSTTPVNYLITMEKYQISDWQGALSMARDKQQE